MKNNENNAPFIWDWEDLRNANTMGERIAKEYTTTNEERINLEFLIRDVIRKAKKEAFELMAQKAQNEAKWQ